MHRTDRSRVGLSHDGAQGFRNGYIRTPIVLKTGALQTQVRQQSRAAHHTEQFPKPPQTRFRSEQGMAHRQDMQGLHLTVPHIFMRMNHVVTLARHAPGRIREQQLVDPARPPHSPSNRVVTDSGKHCAYRLRKNMNLVAPTELFRQCHRIPFRTSALGVKVFGQKCNAKSLQGNLTTTQCRTFPAPHRPHFAGKSAYQ